MVVHGVATDFELGWIVGILEGEGCFSVLRQIRRNRTQYYEYPRVTLSMTDRDVVQSFKDILGISQNIHTWEQTGERLKRGHRTLYSLSVMGDTAEAIMLSVAEHMHSRRKSRIQEILKHAGKKRLEGSGEEVCQTDRRKPVLVEQRRKCGHRGAGVSGTGETRKQDVSERHSAVGKGYSGRRAGQQKGRWDTRSKTRYSRYDD